MNGWEDHERTTLDFDQLKLDPLNVRRTYRGIDQLASSIIEHGLLQNLIVRPDPNEEDSYFVTAGNRRYKALEKLKSGWRPEGQEKEFFDFEHIPCLVSTDARRIYEQTIENVQREEVPIWDLGRRYCEMQELGATQLEIAARIKKNSGHVSRAIRIARGIDPKVIKRLEGIPYSSIPENTLLQIAALPPLNDYGDINVQKQLDMVEHLIAGGAFRTRKRGPISGKERVKNRIKYLKRASVPREHYRTYSIIMAYLTGKTKTIDWSVNEEFF